MMQSGRKGGEFVPTQAFTDMLTCDYMSWTCVVSSVYCNVFLLLLQLVPSPFFSRHHVQRDHWLLAQDSTWWGWQGFFQGSLVQRAQRHGRRLCAGVVRWAEESHLIRLVTSLSNLAKCNNFPFYGLCILPYLWEQTYSVSTNCGRRLYVVHLWF